MIIKDGIIVYGDGVSLTSDGAFGDGVFDSTTTTENSTLIAQPEPEPFKGGRFNSDRTLTVAGKSDLSEELKSLAAEARYYHEVSHPVLDTSRESQNMVNKAWAACQMTPHAKIDFKMPDGSWVAMTKSQIDPLAAQVFSWVEGCFSRERAICEQIDSMTNESDIAAIDMESGWPQG